MVDLTNDEYHSCSKYWSSTALKVMASTSPAHFKARYIDRSVLEKEPTDKMILGSLVHCLILTPERFEFEFFVSPDVDRRTKEGKARWQEAVSANVGKTAVSEEMMISANRMKESCLSNRQAFSLLEGLHREISFFWTCPLSGLNLRARADGASSKHFVELKTTSDASPEFFSRHLHNMNYDLSLIHYQEGIRHTMNVAPPPYFIVIEDHEPYVCQVYKAGDSVLELGHEKWVDAVTKIENGIKHDRWPGYSDQAQEILVIEEPRWAMPKAEPEPVSDDDDIF